jgi:hypothetical protein
MYTVSCSWSKGRVILVAFVLFSRLHHASFICLKPMHWYVLPPGRSPFWHIHPLLLRFDSCEWTLSTCFLAKRFLLIDSILLANGSDRTEGRKAESTHQCHIVLRSFAFYISSYITDRALLSSSWLPQRPKGRRADSPHQCHSILRSFAFCTSPHESLITCGGR